MEQVTSGSIVKLIPDSYCYNWIILKSHIWKSQTELTSPSFVTGANNENKWCLKLDETYKLFICLQDCKEDTVNAIIQVLEEFFPEEECNIDGTLNTVKFTKGLDKFLYDFPNLCFVYNNRGSSNLHNQLTITCEIRHEPKTCSVLGDGILMSDLRLIFKNGENSDVKVKVGRREFPAHKFMLAMRSPVFSAMFQHNMNENQRNVIEVTDVDCDTMKQLLEYIYTSRVTNIDEVPDTLLIAAHKYKVEGLKSMCSNMLIEKIDKDNLYLMLKLAVQYQADDLKAGVLDYISVHRKDNLPLASLREIIPRLEINFMY